MPLHHRALSVRSTLLAATILASALAGCASNGNQAAPPEAPQAPQPAESASTATSPSPNSSQPSDPLDPEVEEFLAQLSLEEQQRQAEARQRMALARRLTRDLEFLKARKEAQIAYRLHPTAETRQLLDDIGLMLGDRRQEVAVLTRDWADGEKVRRQAHLNQLKTLLHQGEELLDQGQPKKAAENFQRVIFLIEWLNEENTPLDTSELERKAKAALEKLRK